MRENVLVTGATGWVGGALVERLARVEMQRVRALTRRAGTDVVEGVESVGCADLSDSSDLSTLVAGCTSVIHAAARVHVMQSGSSDDLDAFRCINTLATERLAQAAAAAGVRRFVFLSSIKVNGEQTAPDTAFTAENAPDPQDAYAASKHEAEIALRAVAADTGMQVVIVRPPLVYGPGVRANFAALLRAVARGVPLPLASVRNQRSLIALPNLVDFVVACMNHPAAADQTFVVSDGEDLSTPELVQRMAAALGHPARLLPVPVVMLRAAAALLGRQAAIDRLCGNLQIDQGKARELLGWTPPVGVDEALRSTVQGMSRR